MHGSDSNKRKNLRVAVDTQDLFQPGNFAVLPHSPHHLQSRSDSVHEIYVDCLRLDNFSITWANLNSSK